MFCVKCGKELADGAMFCKFCGEPQRTVDTDKTEFLGERTEFLGNIEPPVQSVPRTGTVVLNSDGIRTEVIDYQKNNTNTTGGSSAGNSTFANAVRSTGPVELKYRDHFLNMSNAKMIQYTGKPKGGLGVGNALLLVLLVISILGSVIGGMYILNKPVDEIDAPSISREF